ncbi:MAG: hypothetical protein PHI96_04280 [Desulfovibrio sp.]|nr:hypothetical protein [Desulfovibrio sp.]
MDTATSHALILTAAAVVIWHLARTLLMRAYGRKAEARGGQTSEPLSVDDLEARLKEMYAIRARYRLGTITCCVLALLVYFSGGHRLLLLMPLGVACWCQYGIYKHRTIGRLTELRQQRLGRASIEGVAQNRQP